MDFFATERKKHLYTVRFCLRVEGEFFILIGFFMTLYASAQEDSDEYSILTRPD